jgi:hypothetical protein
MGDPIEIKLRGYELSLRKEDARQILLCPPGEKPVQQPHTHQRSAWCAISQTRNPAQDAGGPSP